MILKPDCRHFPGDRPCVYNKTEGIQCDDCRHYDPPDTQICILKLDAVGDVLRTTCILPAIRAAHPHAEILWITRAQALPIFEQNPYVDQVCAYESTETVLMLATREFDIVYSLDASSPTATLASHIRARQKFGYGTNRTGDVVPYTPEAEPWLEMGAFDVLKKENTKTYQTILHEICGLPATEQRIVLHLSDAEKAFASAFRKDIPVAPGASIIGINTGASPRWQYKQWTFEGFSGLIRNIAAETKHTILLYGGPYEEQRNRDLAAIAPDRVFNTGTNNTLRQFFALVSLSDVFLTGDTLALHAATALARRVVAYFGPTSVAEIDTYGGQVVKIHSNLDCLCCYKPTCAVVPHCMESLSVSAVFESLMTAVRETPPGKE